MEIMETNIKYFVDLLPGDIFTLPNLKKAYMKTEPLANRNCVDIVYGTFDWFEFDAEVVILIRVIKPEK